MKPLKGGVDQLDLDIIARLRRDALVTNKAIAQELGVVESTIGSRIRSLSDRNIMRVVATHDIRALGCDLLTHLEIFVEGRSSSEVARELAENNRIVTIAVCPGSPPIIAQINATNRADLLETLLSIGSVRGISDMRSTLSVRILKYKSEYSGSLGATELQLDERADITDRILAIVEHDGRIGNREIGRMLGVSESFVRKRLKALTDSGAMKLMALIDPRALGLSCSAFVRLSVAPGEMVALGRQLVEWEEISFASVTTGEFDMMTVVSVTDRDALAELANVRIAGIQGVRRVDVREISDVVKAAINIVRIEPQAWV